MTNGYQDICCLEDIFKDMNTLNHSLQGRAAILIISISVVSEKITGSWKTHSAEDILKNGCLKWFHIIHYMMRQLKTICAAYNNSLMCSLLKSWNKYFKPNFKIIHMWDFSEPTSVYKNTKFRIFWWLEQIDLRD